MRTPISYYGGKQTMLKHILPLIPSHKIYTEYFAAVRPSCSPNGPPKLKSSMTSTWS